MLLLKQEDCKVKWNHIILSVHEVLKFSNLEGRFSDFLVRNYRAGSIPVSTHIQAHIQTHVEQFEEETVNYSCVPIVSEYLKMSKISVKKLQTKGVIHTFLLMVATRI